MSRIQAYIRLNSLEKDQLRYYSTACDGRPVLRATINTEIAVGVIPSMRDTCPRDTGFTFESFSFNSLDKLWILEKSKSSGIFILSKF